MASQRNCVLIYIELSENPSTRLLLTLLTVVALLFGSTSVEAGTNKPRFEEVMLTLEGSDGAVTLSTGLRGDFLALEEDAFGNFYLVGIAHKNLRVGSIILNLPWQECLFIVAFDARAGLRWFTPIAPVRNPIDVFLSAQFDRLIIETDSMAWSVDTETGTRKTISFEVSFEVEDHNPDDIPDGTPPLPDPPPPTPSTGGGN